MSIAYIRQTQFIILVKLETIGLPPLYSSLLVIAKFKSPDTTQCNYHCHNCCEQGTE